MTERERSHGRTANADKNEPSDESQSESDVPEPVRFRDWLSSELDTRSEMLTIANSTDEDVEGVSRARYATFSALVKPSSVTRVLKELSWDIQSDMFRPRFYSENQKIVFERGGMAKVNKTTFWPLLTRRFYHDLAPAYYEITDEFIDYHRLAPDSGHWIQPLTGQTVVRRVSPEHLQVRRDALTDYLAARGLALIRFHDHFRWACAPSKPHRIVHSLKARDVNLERIVDAEPGRMFSCRTGNCWLGMIWGKDALRPAVEPSHVDYLFEKDRLHPEPLPEYLVDDKGTMMRPVSHYGDATSPFLTPVFFRADVLNRYISDSRGFEVDGYFIRDNAGFWGLTYGRSTTGAVIVWLGDLAGDIPSTEHKYWKPYNIPPSGWMREDFYKPQILGQWTDTQDEAVMVRAARRSANEIVKKVLGAPLFRELAQEQAHQLTTLHVPLSNDQGELTQQIAQLAAVIIDALDTELLRRVLPDPKLGLDTKGRRVGSITLLEVVLVARFGVDQERAEVLIRPLRAAQDLRSKLRAHLTSSATIRESLTLAGINPGTEPIAIFTTIAGQVAASVRSIAELIGV